MNTARDVLIAGYGFLGEGVDRAMIPTPPGSGDSDASISRDLTVERGAVLKITLRVRIRTGEPESVYIRRERKLNDPPRLLY
jgi:hypothetical protein